MQKKTCSIAILTLLTAGVIGIVILKRAKQKKISRIVADAGYETAHDIHFPLKKAKRLKF